MAVATAFGTGSGKKATSTSDYVSSYKPTTSSSRGNTPATVNRSTTNPLSTFGVSNTTASNTKSNQDWAIEQRKQQIATQNALNNLNTDRGGDDTGGTVATTTTSSGGGGGGGSYSPTVQQTNYENELVEKIKSYLNEQADQARKYYETLYGQQKAQNEQSLRNNERQINLNRELGTNVLRRGANAPQSAYGMIGPMARIASRWQSDLNTNRQNYENNNATALAQYNNNLANVANTEAQGWYNYVLPVYTNRQNYSDSLANQLKMNALDLDYRKYLAGLGI